jgi:TolB-like protein
MGEVYRARDEKLGRDIALKVLPRDLAQDAERRARLLQEARAAASLNHPNICTIHEVGEAEGAVYIAMEVIDGEPLSARLAGGAFPADELLRYGVQLADALAHAHDRGIVHRDLKSANVMITSDGRVKVLDFGLAKRLKGDAHADLTTHVDYSLTVPGAIVGTVPYMAPEQLRGEPADARSDVWALGVVLYEMASGVRPFRGQTAFELSSAVFHTTPAPLPAAVPDPLKTVTARCLEKDPAARYQRGADVRRALEAPATAEHTAVTTRRPATGARRRILLTSMAAAFAVVATAAWLLTAEFRARPVKSSDRIQSIAVLPLENLAGTASEDYFVTGMHEALITDLARIGLRKVIAKPSADAFKGTKKSLADIGRELGVDGLVTGTVLRAQDRVQLSAQLVNASTGAVLWANRYERQLGDVLTLQNELVGAIARELRATLTPEQTTRLASARPVNPAAHDAYLKGRSLFAEYTTLVDRPRFDAVLAQFERTIELDPTYAPPYAALTVLYLSASQSSLLPPKDTFTKARAAALKAVSLDDALPDAHAALGEVYLWYDWNWASAEREIQRALQLNPDSTDALRSSEVFLTLVSGKFDEAARAAQRILDLDPLNPFSRIQTIWVSFFSRRHEESVSRAKSLLDVSPNNFMGPFFLAANYAVTNSRDGVVAECGKIMSQLGGAYVMQAIGTCAWAQGLVGHTDEARRLLARLERPPAGIWLDPVVMAQAYGGLGEIDRAIDWCQKGLDERSPNMIYLKAGAHFDPLRSDPRFQKLVREMNFPD